MNQSNSSNQTMLSSLKYLEQKVNVLQVIVILAMCVIVILLLLNMCFNRWYARRLTRYINAQFGFNQFDRQILMPPTRKSSSEFTSPYYFYNDEINNNNNKMHNLNEFRGEDHFPSNNNHMNGVRPFISEQVNEIENSVTYNDAMREEQIGFLNFPVLSLSEANRTANTNTTTKKESPMKPLVDLMNNRSRAYQKEMQSKKRISPDSSSNKQEFASASSHIDSFQKKKVLISTVTSAEHQDHRFRTRNMNGQAQSFLNAEYDQQQQQYSIRREKSVENITITQMKRSKSWDPNNKKLAF